MFFTNNSPLTWNLKTKNYLDPIFFFDNPYDDDVHYKQLIKVEEVALSHKKP
jgi:hypothetical protein